MTSSSEIGGEGTASSSSADVKNWDLTSTISPYLDLHMMFPLLEYVDSLIEAGLVMPSYNTADVAQARLSLLRPTHMVDYAMDIYRELKGEDAEVPQEMEIRKKAVYEKMEELRAGCAALEELCANETAKVSFMYLNTLQTHFLRFTYSNLILLILGRLGRCREVERFGLGIL